jgi:hypothetical protein
MNSPDTSTEDKLHLTKWLKSEAADDYVPAEIVADPITRRDIIAYALHGRQIAEAAGRGHDPIRRDYQNQREQLLSLSKKSEELAAYFMSVEQYSGIASFYQRFFLPARSLWMFHDYEAKLLRQRFSREPGPTTFISRQTGGAKKRARSRMYNAFIVFMVMRMIDEFNKPHCRVVATLTKMVFPEAAITTSDVQETRRRGRAYMQRNAPHTTQKPA